LVPIAIALPEEFRLTDGGTRCAALIAPGNLAIALGSLRCNFSMCSSNSGVIFPLNPETPLFVAYLESVPGGQVLPSFGGTSLLKWYQSSIWTASITSLAVAGLF